MWRVIQGATRVFRQQFQSVFPSAVTINGEDACPSKPQKSKTITSNTDIQEKEVKMCRAYIKEDEKTEKSYQKKQSQEERQKTTNKEFWSVFNKEHSPLEALGWGAAVFLGIQITRYNWKKRECTAATPQPYGICSVAFALPPNSGARQKKHVSVADKKQQEDVSEKKHENDSNFLAEAMNDFSHMCENYTAVGKNIIGLQKLEKGDISGAIHSWEEAGKLGYSKANFNLAMCYEIGQGVERNLSKAVEYYKLAAEENHPAALYNLAVVYLSENSLSKDEAKAIEYLEKAADLGLAQAQTYLGIYYMEEKKNMSKAATYFREAASQNDTDSQYFLGICYEQGWGVEKNECKAANLYTQSSENGHDCALYNLGVFHEYGLGGIPEDKISAKQLYEKAAALGNENAKLRLQGFEARAVLNEWKDELKSDLASNSRRINTSSPNLRLSPSNSSPSLTDYVRDNLSVFAFSMDKIMNEIDKPSGDETRTDPVTFTIGYEEDDDNDFIIQDTMFSSPTVETYLSSKQFLSGNLSRNSTMPDLQLVDCH